MRLSAVEARAVAQLRLGQHDLTLDDLTAAVAEQPLDERFRELLMLALYRSGRAAAALEVYRQTRVLLADELGVDPALPLQVLHRSILHARDVPVRPVPGLPVRA